MVGGLTAATATTPATSPATATTPATTPTPGTERCQSEPYLSVGRGGLAPCTQEVQGGGGATEAEYYQVPGVSTTRFRHCNALEEIFSV